MTRGMKLLQKTSNEVTNFPETFNVPAYRTSFPPTGLGQQWPVRWQSLKRISKIYKPYWTDNHCLRQVFQCRWHGVGGSRFYFYDWHILDCPFEFLTGFVKKG
jgi:hypothetical protein